MGVAGLADERCTGALCQQVEFLFGNLFGLRSGLMRSKKECIQMILLG